jgi:hypothetical protein
MMQYEVDPVSSLFDYEHATPGEMRLERVI